MNNLILPKNIFTEILNHALPDEYKNSVRYDVAIKIATELESNSDLIGLVTPADLLLHKDLYVSSKVGISFTGNISNSYLYFTEDKENISEVLLAGDITTLEAMYAEIFFKEQYNLDIKLSIVKERKLVNKETLLLIGNSNFKDDHYIKGLSFGSEMVDMLEVPFVNFVFASMDKEKIEKLNDDLAGIESKIYTLVESGNFNFALGENSILLVKDELPSVIYEFNEQDIEGIKQLTRLPFYYGKSDDLIEINFV